MSTNYLLKLYITGQTPKSTRAIQNLQQTCETLLAGNYDLIVIDVLEHPELAEEDKILATPTLIRLSPPPLRRVIGDLTDTEKVLWGLDLKFSPEVNHTKGGHEE